MANYRTLDIPRHLINRIASGMMTLRAWPQRGGPETPTTPTVFGGSPPNQQQIQAFGSNMQVAASDPNNAGWFGPSDPITPMAPKDQVAGRQFDYPSGANIGFLPRQEEQLSFTDLRGLAESLDLVKLCIQTRLDQMETQKGGVLPKKAAGTDIRGKADDRCQQIETFLQSPDRKHTHDQWRRVLFYEMLTIDAPCVYVRRTLGGDVYSLDIVDGASIVPKIALDGRAPDAPGTAYQQILKGVPAVDYSTDELIYLPRNPRVNKLYGYSPVEHLVTTINIAVRRDVQKMSYFSDGNIPDSVMPMPPDWGPEKIEQWQKLWDALMQDVRERAGRVKFVPGGGGTMQFLRNDTLLFGQPDEWFARLVAYCFNLSPQAFVQMMNRATGETAQEMAQDEGLMPMRQWFKSLMDIIIQKFFGYTDLEWVWADDDMSPQELSDLYLPLFDRGIVSGDEIRGKLGMDPLGLPPIMRVGPMGFMSVQQVIDAINSGANLQPAPAQPGMMPGQTPMVGGGAPVNGPVQQLPGPGGMTPALAPPAVDPMSRIPPDLLAAVGLGPQGPAGRQIHVTSQDEFEADPLAPHVGHPKVLSTLRQVEQAQRRRAAVRR